MPIVYLLGVLAVVGVFLFLKKFYLVDARRMTSRATGQVVAAEERVVVTEKERWVETRLTVEYIVGGRTWTVSGHLHGDRAKYFPPGRELTVRYNPANPDMAEVVI